MSTEPGIHVEVPAGELIDKITILEIKAVRITDAGKLENVHRELQVLCQARDAAIQGSAELDTLTSQLKAINQILWQVEDAIRDCERNQDFGPEFIELARRVYQTNDRRAELKRQINQLLGSRFVEEKSYAVY
jgi:DNA repair exonuclease SbcCD ATPase subunit